MYVSLREPNPEQDDDDIQLRVAFSMVDVDRSGSIDFDELRNAMYSLGQQIPDNVLRGKLTLITLNFKSEYQKWLPMLTTMAVAKLIMKSSS